MDRRDAARLIAFGGISLAFMGCVPPRIFDLGHLGEEQRLFYKKYSQIGGYREGRQERHFKYVLDGKRGSIKFEVYPKLHAALAAESKTLCFSIAPTDGEFCSSLVRHRMGQAQQLAEISSLANEISRIGQDAGVRVRIALSVVQNIEYVKNSLVVDRREMEEFNGVAGRENGCNAFYYSNVKFPYEALCYGGACGEKALLASLLLGRLGIGSAVFFYLEEGHVKTGIKCEERHSYKGCGYVPVDVVEPAIIGYNGFMAPAGTMRSEPIIIRAVDGGRMEGIGGDLADARFVEGIGGMEPQLFPGGSLEGVSVGFNEWAKLQGITAKYGLRWRFR